MWNLEAANRQTFSDLRRKLEKKQRSKRLRQEDENTPGIVVDAPSTSTLLIHSHKKWK